MGPFCRLVPLIIKAVNGDGIELILGDTIDWPVVPRVDIVSSWNGVLTNRGKKVTGGRPPIAMTPPEVPRSTARLKRGAIWPSLYMFANIGLDNLSGV